MHVLWKSINYYIALNFMGTGIAKVENVYLVTKERKHECVEHVHKRVGKRYAKGKVNQQRQ